MKNKNCFNLFLQTLLLSTFTFGGGYTIVSLMQKKFVDELHWLTEDEMLDIVAVAQSGCGAIVVNTSVMLGYSIAGIRGALCAVFGTVLPPFLILIPIAFFYDLIKDNLWISFFIKAMRSGVSAIIISVVYDMILSLIKKKNGLYYVIFIISFAVAFFTDVNVIIIIVSCIIVGVVYTLLKVREQKNDIS